MWEEKIRAALSGSRSVILAWSSSSCRTVAATARWKSSSVPDRIGSPVSRSFTWLPSKTTAGP